MKIRAMVYIGRYYRGHHRSGNHRHWFLFQDAVIRLPFLDASYWEEGNKKDSTWPILSHLKNGDAKRALIGGALDKRRGSKPLDP